MAQLKDLLITGASRFIGDIYGTNGTFTGDILPGKDNTYNIGSVLFHWKNIYATTFNGNATSSDRLNTDAGSGTQPIYFKNGVPVASTATVGSAVKPIYLNSGTITVSNSTVGSGTKPIYLNSGTLTVSSSTVGASNQPVYLNKGEITASTSTIGSTSKPIFMSNGVLTAFSTSIGNDTTFVYVDKGEIKISSKTVGSSKKPVYMASGEISVSDASIGATNVPIYMHAGELTAFTSTIGANNKPIYLDNGIIKASDTSIGSTLTPIYMNSGVLTASTSTVGSSSKPMYLNKGIMTAVDVIGTSCGGTGQSSYSSNRLLYVVSTSTSTKFFSADGLYSTGSNLAINSTTDKVGEVSYKFLVDGSSYLGGATTIAGSMVASGGVTFTNGSFNYSGIEAGTANVTRCVWFSDSAIKGKPCLSTKLQYNPATDILSAGNFSGAGANITSLNASNLASGTIHNNRLPYRLQEYHNQLEALDNTICGFSYVNSSDASLNPFINLHTSYNDFMILSQGYSAVWGSQIATDFRSNSMAIRNKNNGTWNSWATVLTSANYTEYTPIINNAHANKTTSIYAPVSGGTANYVLISSGDGNAPVWTAQTNITAGSVEACNKVKIQSAADTDTNKYLITGTTSVMDRASLYVNSNVYFQKGVMYGAAWNDYAEYRESDITQPGRCIIENGDDTLSLSIERLQRGAEIVSDTFGFAIGETDDCKTPIAASGRVLAYPFEDREQFKSHIGYPVCSGPNGTVSIMTDEEEQLYPSRIIGYVSAVPDYEIWGTGNVKVDGRVWIRIK